MLTLELKRKFVDLSNQLSPENISCDGELTARQVNVRRREIMGEWKVLEREAGRSVSEDEAWPWWEEIQAEDARIIAELQINAPEGWEVTSENVIRHESGCAYIQHWNAGQPYIAFCSVRNDLWWANKWDDYHNDKGGKELLGECETQEEAITLIRAYFDTLTDDDILNGIRDFLREDRFELAKTLRN